MRFRAEIERGLGKTIVSSLAAFLDQHMGPVYEEAFRAYLRRMANEGALGKGIVDVGPWWSDDSQQETPLPAPVMPAMRRAPARIAAVLRNVCCFLVVLFLALVVQKEGAWSAPDFLETGLIGTLVSPEPSVVSVRPRSAQSSRHVRAKE
jgi:hypothetical protein